MSSLLDTIHPFWKRPEALDNLTPRNDRWPEGDLLKHVIDYVCVDHVVEIGCGDGRLARCITPFYYLGLEQNAALLEKARYSNPDWNFELLTDVLPKGNTALFWNVLMHVKDEYLPIWAEATDRYDRIVIGEVMHNRLRNAEGKVPCFNRDLENYLVMWPTRKPRTWRIWIERYSTELTVLALDKC